MAPTRPIVAIVAIVLALSIIGGATGTIGDVHVDFPHRSDSCDAHSTLQRGTLAKAAAEHARGLYLEQLSWQPRAYLMHNILTREECLHLIRISEPRLKTSQVHDPKTGNLRYSINRTSQSGWLNRDEDQVVRHIGYTRRGHTYLRATACSSMNFDSDESDGNIVFSHDQVSDIVERVSRHVGAPASHVRYISVLRYTQEQYYREHLDTADLNTSEGQSIAEGSGHRFATALLYLSDVEGGETAFPNGTWIDGSDMRNQTFSECMGHGASGVLVKPKLGSGLLFYSLDNAGEIDVTSLHAGCPVVQGTKWVATLWFHQSPVNKMKATGGRCRDKHYMCPHWARHGECLANPLYMTGNPDIEGNCLRSCNACKEK